MSLAESMESAAAEALKATLPEVAPDVPEETENTATMQPATDESTEDVGDVEEAQAADADAEPEQEQPDVDGYVKVPVVADKLATEFTIRDAEGEMEVPDVIIEYKANGKVRKDRLDQVVKLAQFGVYNEERERKVQETERNAMELAQAKAESEKVLSEREAQLERILQDENFYLAVREAYERENSPEQRAKRAEEEAKALRAEREYAPVIQHFEQFNDGEVVPALEMIVQNLPLVSMEELEDKLGMAALAHAETAPTGTRFIHPSRFDAIRKYIVEDLAIWAQVQQARRSESRQSPELATAKAETDKARVEAQKAKRLVGQATKPVGSTGGKAAPKKAKAPATIDEAMAQAEAEILASVGVR